MGNCFYKRFIKSLSTLILVLLISTSGLSQVHQFSLTSVEYSSPIVLERTVYQPSFPYQCQMIGGLYAVGLTTFYTAFIGISGSSRYVVFAKSTNGGQTWTTEVITVGATIFDIKLEVYGNYIFVSYISGTTNNLYLSYSSDGGSTWTTVNIPVNAYIMDMSVIDSNNIVLAYYDTTLNRYRIAKTSDRGLNWTFYTPVDIAGSLYYQVAIASKTSDEFYLTFNIGNDVYFTKTTDGGSNWSVYVTFADGYLISKSLKFFNGLLTVTVQDSYNTLFHGRSEDYGNLFTYSRVMNNVSYSNSASPVIIDKEKLSIGFYDSNGDVFLANSINSGYSWNSISLIRGISIGFSGEISVSFYKDTSSYYVFLICSNFYTFRFASIRLTFVKKFVAVKDASTGRTLSEGLMAVVPYVWDGESYVALGSVDLGVSVSSIVPPDTGLQYLIQGATDVQTGSTITLDFLCPRMTWEIYLTGGTLSNFRVNLEGSIDGVSFYILDYTTDGTQNQMRHVVNKPIRYVRANITSWTVGSGSPILYVLFRGGY